MHIRNNGLKKIERFILQDKEEDPGIRAKVLHESLANSFHILGSTRKTKFWFNLATKGKIHSINPTNNDSVRTFTSNMDSIISTLKAVYPNNNWDIRILSQSFKDDDGEYTRHTYTPQIVIHHPKIQIENSAGLSHEIKDLFVVLTLDADEDSGEVYIAHIQGTRGTLKFDEWYSGYWHSHLPERSKKKQFSSMLNLGTFCLNQNEVGDLIVQLQSKFDKYVFELLLLTFDTMLAWESLEGVPHVYIQKIGVASTYSYSYTRSQMKEAYREIQAIFPEKLPIDFFFNQGRFKVKNNKRLSEFLKEILADSRIDSQHFKNLFVTEEDGQWYKYPDKATLADKDTLKGYGFSVNHEEPRPYTVIQGHKHFFNIQTQNLEEKPSDGLYQIHPTFINYVIQQLEILLYGKAIRKSAIEAATQINNASRSLPQDTVSM